MKKIDVQMFALRAGIVGGVLAFVFGFVLTGCGSSPQFTGQEQASAYIEEADADKRYEQGNVYLAKGEYNKAIVEYTEAIRLYAEERRGGGISVIKSLEESLQEFGKSTLRLINYRDAHRKRGDAYAAIGDMEKANADYDKAKEIIPDLPSDIKTSVNREQASAYIEEADADKRYEQGNVYLAKGEYNKAIVEYTEAIRLYAEERRGGGISVIKSLEESLQGLGKSIQRLINYRDGHKKRGDAYAAIGDMEKANADYDKAKEIIPDLPSDIKQR